ncbi:pitrilysin family protein [Aliiglaciecola sp. CAU 1673]|uniref:M16 family metallopeptidase n=1 Tax=Aliiglaciecola sp. CAU 1673 TaxID=3032595 RepID=UPI0023DAD2A8|nr:pitrilysin family protein [Aliiglaciecola sp. CAU 1673]MDF2178033.1 pitrilysin family protein [Aliiglaciecola sp. CAU 1673]
MRTLKTFASLFLLTLGACSQSPSPEVLPPGIQLVEQHQNTGSQGLAFKKYRLNNGLTLILHADHSDPLVHVDVTYHVGSSREEPGKSGFAHFFEHMMFQGSDHVADEQHFKIITEAGGTLNGTTNSDRTNYYQTVPANQLEKVLWLEADRMGFLLPAVTQEKFEIQRETVKNERAQNVDNQPYGLRLERTAEALYPAGHPYSWPTIGYPEDLQRVDVTDLKRFFATWYGPNNAVLTIGGDFDEQQVLDWVVKYFASIPAGPAVEPLKKEQVRLPQSRHLVLEDDVHLPLLQLTLPTVYARHEDEAALDVLADILGGGKTSLFYKNLVKQGIAVNAAVSHPCRELACEFQLIALAHPSRVSNLGELQQIIQSTLNEFEQRGVMPDDLVRTKTTIEAGTIYGLQSVAGKVSTLAANEVFEGQPDLLQFDLDRYAAVTEEDVMRVYRRYIKDKPAVVLSIVPRGQTELAAAPSDFTKPQAMPTDQESAQSPALRQKVVADDFDRNQVPPAGPNPLIHVPAFWQTQWQNGIEIIGHQSKETPTVTLTLSMEGGPLLDPIEKAGLAWLTAQMMNESTKTMSTEQLANELSKLGSQIYFGAAGRHSQITVSSLSKNLAETLELLQQKLFQPAFLQEDFERIRQQALQGIQQQLKDPERLASRGVSQLLFGEQNRVSLPDQGTLTTLASVTLEDVKAFYQRYYSPAKAKLVLVGDVEQQRLLAQLNFLKLWQGQDYVIPDYADFPELKEAKLYFIDRPGANQSVVKLFKPSLPYDATGEHFKSKLMNFPLGGMFNSRINLKLREEKGFTYGANSMFVGGKTLGWFEAASSVKQDNTAEAIEALMAEIDRYAEEGMSQAELTSLRQAYLQAEALDYETPGQKVGFLRHLVNYDLPPDVVKQQHTVIKNISTAELNALAAKHLQLDSMQLLVVGDKAQIMDQLSGLNRDIVEVNITE